MIDGQNLAHGGRGSRPVLQISSQLGATETCSWLAARRRSLVRPGWAPVYDRALCVPLRPYRPATPAQITALEAGRALPCIRCGERVETEGLVRGICVRCWSAEASATARAWLDADPLILDTETTGLGDDAEVIEVSVIDAHGQVLLDTLVRRLSDPWHHRCGRGHRADLGGNPRAAGRACRRPTGDRLWGRFRRATHRADRCSARALLDQAGDRLRDAALCSAQRRVERSTQYLEMAEAGCGGRGLRHRRRWGAGRLPDGPRCHHALQNRA